MNIFEWIFNKKELEKELEKLDRDLDMEKAKNNKLNKKIDTIKEQMEFLETKDFEKIVTIKELRKKIKFLNKREKKLQTIEMIFENQPIDLKKLSNLIKED